MGPGSAGGTHPGDIGRGGRLTMSVMKAALDSPDLLAEEVDRLRTALRLRNPVILAGLTGAHYEEMEPGKGLFRLPFWERETMIPFPELTAQDENGQPLGTLDQALLAYYFSTSDGTPQTGRWMGFSELPNGRFYTAAFQGYTGQKLMQTFGDDVDRFARVAVKLNGRAASLGSQAFSFAILPRVSLLVVCWLGDEDFLTSYRVLFDTAVSHHLPTDGCAILGSVLTRRLIREVSMRNDNNEISN
ncbi:MAG TPA: DUF3786 domain-containing protein [Anaerolineae bacterium]|nr:DUF3786 domain-containing protein [Anaerolineae bacterium]